MRECGEEKPSVEDTELDVVPDDIGNVSKHPRDLFFLLELKKSFQVGELFLAAINLPSRSGNIRRRRFHHQGWTALHLSRFGQTRANLRVKVIGLLAPLVFRNKSISR